MQDRPRPTGDIAGPLYPVTSVDNALRLLLLLRHQQELRLSQAAAELGVANSTAHRLLAMLQHHGFVRQDSQTKAYHIGPALLEVGLAAVRAMDIRDLARPMLEELAAETGETVHLAVLEGAQVRYLDAVESANALRVAARTGMTLPAHCTAVGKVLLAELDPAELHSLFPSSALPATTQRSITSRTALERELGRVRARGYAVNSEESEEGVSSMAVAIRHPQRGVIAAVSCAAPSVRLSAERIEKIAPIVSEAAAELGSRLA